MIDEFIPPTPERLAMPDIDVDEGDRGGKLIRSFAFPLDFLHRRGIISGPEHSAGNKLHQLWYHGFAAQYRLMRYGHTPSSDDNFEATRLLAIEYVDALRAVRGIREQEVAYEVCCRGTTVSLLPGFSSKPTARREGVPLLRSGLADLVRHFGY